MQILDELHFEPPMIGNRAYDCWHGRQAQRLRRRESALPGDQTIMRLIHRRHDDRLQDAMLRNRRLQVFQIAQVFPGLVGIEQDLVRTEVGQPVHFIVQRVETQPLLAFRYGLETTL